MTDKPMSSFEERLKNLEELTSKLEEGNLSIDSSIEVYRKGLELAAGLKKSLDEMQQKVTDEKGKVLPIFNQGQF